MRAGHTSVRSKLGRLSVVDQLFEMPANRIDALHGILAILETARGAYDRALKEALAGEG